MTPAQFQRVKELFDALAPLAGPDRRRALDVQCGDDPAVRGEVERLLADDGDADRRLADVARQISTILAPARGGTRRLVGRRVGAYEVVRVVGQGGMGVVYLGRDTRLGRQAALKAVLPGGEHDPTLVERLRREARVLASLSHPNLATVYGLEEEHGTLFLAMEFVEGKSLSERLGRSPMPVPDALQCCEQIAAGLEAAHEAGIVHRDLKPGNAMVAADGTVKLLDFGLARDLRGRRDGAVDADGPCEEPDTRSAPLTREGSFFGTPAYMSPEQARCEPVDRRSDLYSLGSVLFRCLAGRPPFEGESDRELVEAVLTHEPDWSKLPANVPASVHAILRRCLAKDPADRYRHAGDLRLDLRDARAARGWERKGPARTRGAFVRRLVPWAAAALGLAAGVAGLWLRPIPPTRENVGAAADAAQRFDLGFPSDATQGDLERLQLAVSPSGKDVVVACKVQDKQALWVRSHGDGRWRPIDQTDGAHRPVFSADGQWIAFFRDGHIYKHRPTGGGDPVPLATTSNWYGAALADDGALVYSPAWGDPLQRLAPGDAKPRPCSKLDAGRGEVSHVGPVVVPGRRWTLFTVWRGGESCDVAAAHVDTGEQHVVAANASTPRVASTPRGDYLLFERGSIIFAAPFDRAAARTTGDESAVAEGVMNDGTRFAAYYDVASDGTVVYVPGTSFAEESRLAYVGADKSTTPFNDDRMSFCEPVFAPTGNRLTVLVKGKVYRALVYDQGRKTPETILSGGDTLALAVSPDGQALACTVNRDGGYGIDLFSLADGRRLGRVADPGPDYQSDLSWSADGKLIAFSMPPKEGVPSDLWLVEPAVGSHPRVLVSTPGADTKPAISPDNKWVAYQSDASGRMEIYLVTYPDGATTRQVTFGGGERPAWSPDAKTLYYVRQKALHSVNVGPGGTITGQPKIVYDKPFGQSDPIAREYTIAPDGRILVVEPSERRPTVSHLQAITRWYRLLP